MNRSLLATGASRGSGSGSASGGGPVRLDVLLDPALNKSTAFTEAERERYKLRGLLPPAVCTQETQMTRVLASLRRQSSDIERCTSLQAVLNRNERLFYRTGMWKSS